MSSWLASYGGFLSHRGTPSHHPFTDRIFPPYLPNINRKKMPRSSVSFHLHHLRAQSSLTMGMQPHQPDEPSMAMSDGDGKGYVTSPPRSSCLIQLKMAEHPTKNRDFSCSKIIEMRKFSGTPCFIVSPQQVLLSEFSKHAMRC